MAKRVVDVLVPVALDQTYSYRVPEGLELAPGDLVTVPLGARMATAVTWAENPKPNPRLDNRMKDVEAKLDVPPLKPELRKFIDWVSAYTLSPRGMVLRMALRMGEHLGPARERVGVRIAGPPPQRMTAARERVLALLADGLARGKRDVAEAAGVSPGVIDALVENRRRIYCRALCAGCIARRRSLRSGAPAGLALRARTNFQDRNPAKTEKTLRLEDHSRCAI